MCEGELIKGSDIIMKEPIKIKTQNRGRVFLESNYILAIDAETSDIYKVVKIDKGFAIMVPERYGFYYLSDIPNVHLPNLTNINGNVYNHFIGKKFMGITKAYDIVNREWYCIYEALYGDFTIYASKEENFENGTSEQYSDEKYEQRERFKLLGNIKDYL